MFQQHHGESLSEAWTRFKDLLHKVPHHGIDLWLQVQIFYDHVNPVTRRTINQSASGKLRDRNAKESWALLEDLALYENKSWNDPKDFAKPVKAITLPQDDPSTSNHRLIELENQICSGPHDTQYCMEDPEKAFVEYASSCTDKAGVLKAITDRIAGALPSDTVKNPKLSTSLVLSARSYPTMDPQCSTHVYGSINVVMIHPKQQSNSHDDKTEENEKEEKVSPENINVDPSTPPDPSVSFITEKVLKLNSFFESLGLVPQSSITELVCTKGDDDDVMFIEIVKKYDDYHEEEPEAGEHEVEYFDIFLTKSELAYHKKFLIKNEKEFFTDAGDGVRIYPDGVASPAITWMAFGGNTRDLGSFGEETDEITNLHQIHKEILFSERGDGVAGIKRCRRDPSSDGIRDLVTVFRRGRLNEDLESST
ncbi:hypothetical protein Tco_0264789 [Tanacetum coccineum]